MNNILNKFKNIHFLWLVGVICFLTFYVPVRYFTTYVDYVPEWTLPIFVFFTMMPLWFHEFAWKTSRLASDSYIVFHQLHDDDNKWRKGICNPFYFLRKYISWLCRKPLFWLMNTVLIVSISYGYIAEYNENDFHPFLPFYVINSIWWIGIIKEFVIFRNDAREGIVNYRIREY